jgi:hypothetical protein
MDVVEDAFDRAGMSDLEADGMDVAELHLPVDVAGGIVCADQRVGTAGEHDAVLE